ncbi:UDP-glucose 6-dehydrogenase [Corynebacterium phocae]|uniref:UDP-glucose 6-dehydrogenase n=1 Tax=Corynebacterium phocae TaxID=161895 RepID=A0A1L7D5H5_9CORY|nr:UDP-glucose/GDP-mannose dehydrogenase family protein [Corynebacterium phocae]APT93360.1 UDP-glucose 6-dehydrogenase [Corynebacterium phocae]KAA8721698.1 UDP-glucose/GDP-mannose dehydrogenase family protein [Corynebacterium phocae]
MRMTVIGTGYLGATHAACMAELGHEVLGVDVDESKIKSLQAGQVPFFEPGLPEVLERNIAAGRLDFTTDYAQAAQFANVHFLGVGTPQRHGSFAADLTYVRAVIEDLVPKLTGSHIIFGKSTVPVGTARDLQELANSLAGPDTHVEIAWNPEFLREGYAVQDTITPDRIVLGVREEASRAEEVAREVYAQALEASTPLLVTDLQTAELVKVSANAFLATKISFINAVAEICEIAGGDVVALADAIGLDERIGRKFLGAGLGFGGGCLPKDIRAFMARAGELGADQALSFLREVDAINMRRRDRMVDVAKRALGGSVLGRRVTVLGCAFKPNSDDVRDSPALSVAGSLSLAGAAVTVYDPEGMDNARRVFPTLAYATSASKALQDTELVILATEWQEFRDLDPAAAGELVAARHIIDGRNVLDVAAWQAAGWTVEALGRNL